MQLKILSEYSFLVIALGCSCLAFATGLIGTVNILRNQSLIGDAVGHASFPGIVFAFILAGRRDSLSLMAGAVAAGLLAFYLITVSSHDDKTHGETAMAVILSAFFGLGMAAKSFIQGNPNFTKNSQAGLANYIFGQAAYMLREDVVLIFIISLVSLLLFFLFYQEIKIFVFDPAYSKSVGISRGLLSALIMIMTMCLIAAGLKAVGAILISSMLIAPGVSALQWSEKYSHVLWISGLIGGFSALGCTILSTLVKGMSTGPCIILFMSAAALFSVFASPKGILHRKRQPKRKEGK